MYVLIVMGQLHCLVFAEPDQGVLSLSTPLCFLSTCFIGFCALCTGLYGGSTMGQSLDMSNAPSGSHEHQH